MLAVRNSVIRSIEDIPPPPGNPTHKLTLESFWHNKGITSQARGAIREMDLDKTGYREAGVDFATSTHVGLVPVGFPKCIEFAQSLLAKFDRQIKWFKNLDTCNCLNLQPPVAQGTNEGRGRNLEQLGLRAG